MTTAAALTHSPAERPTVQLLDLKPSQIQPHPSNPREDVGDVAELAESIRQLGVLEPLIVAPGAPRGKHWLIAGHRRLAAAKAAGTKTLPCLVRDDLDSPARQIEAMLVENLQRTDLTAVEEGAAYQQLLEFPGYTLTKISKQTGRALGTVRARVGIAKLPEDTRKRIHTGQITIEQATELAKHAADPAALRRLERAAGTSSWTWELQRIKDAATQQRREASTRKALAAAGVRVVEDGDLPDHWQWKRTPDVATLRGLGIDPAEHTDCPGHAAGIAYADAVYICTTPSAHPEPHNADDPFTAEHAAEEAEQKRLEDMLKTAAVLRRAHLAAAICEGAQDTARELALTVVQDRIRKQWTRSKQRIRELLGAGEKANAADVAAAIAGHSLAQLVILRDVLDHLDDEDTLDRLYTWRDGSYSQAWRTRLGTIYGWEWTPGELDALRSNAAEDAAEDAATEAAAADDGA